MPPTIAPVARRLCAWSVIAVVASGLSACTANDRSATHEPTPPSAVTEGGEDGIVVGDKEAIELEIYAGEAWYRARSEPEVLWRGVLQPREVELGPGARQALLYQLITEEGDLAVYAANAQPRLEPLVGRQVSVVGKLVDLSDEGLGQELWIASIETANP